MKPVQYIRSLPARAKSAFRDKKSRIDFATLMAFSAGVIMYSQAGIVLPNGMPLHLFTGIVYAIVVGPAAFLTCLFLPAVSSLIEPVALTRMGYAVGVVSFPEFAEIVLGSPLLTAGIIVGGAIMLQRLARWAKPYLPELRPSPAQTA